MSAISIRPKTTRHAFEAVVQRTADDIGCLVGSFQTNQGNSGDLFDDDCTATFVVSGKAAQALKKRLLDRLAEIFCGHPSWHDGAIALMKENDSMKSVDIWIAPYEPNPSMGNKVQLVSDGMLSKVADILSRIHEASSGKSHIGSYLPVR
jgi:hypothetical protein